jgi:hypothetical protein
MTNSAPELGALTILDVISTNNCIRDKCKSQYDTCKINKHISAKSGVSAGDNYNNTKSVMRQSEALRRSIAVSTAIISNPNITFSELHSITKAPKGYHTRMYIDLNHWHTIPNGKTAYPPKSAGYFYYLGTYNNFPYWININGVCIWYDGGGIYHVGSDLAKKSGIEKHNGFTYEYEKMKIGWYCRNCAVSFEIKLHPPSLLNRTRRVNPSDRHH